MHIAQVLPNVKKEPNMERWHLVMYCSFLQDTDYRSPNVIVDLRSHTTKYQDTKTNKITTKIICTISGEPPGENLNFVFIKLFPKMH